MTKDISVIGGTFDPVHIGHIEMINYLITHINNSEVLVLPSYNSPHKSVNTINSYEHRINMLNIALKGFDNVHISRFEEEYSKFNPMSKTYTYEVLNELKKYYKDNHLHFVVGFDSIKEISSWHRYLELIRDYEFYIFDREDDEFKTREQKIFYLDNLGKHQGIQFRYKFFDFCITNISSTSIRTMLQNINEYKTVLNLFMDKQVLKYIEDYNLYK